MSQENVEAVRAVYRSTSRAGVYNVLDDDVEWDARNTAGPDAGIYRGLEAFKRAYDAWRDAWDRYEVALDELIDAGSSVIAVTRQRGRGKRSGIEIGQPIVAVYTFRGAKVVRFRVYETKAEALEAVEREQ